MQQAIVKKDELRKRVQDNRDAHQEIYEKALEGWVRAAKRFFDQQVQRIARGERFVVAFGEVKPENHIEDYDAVLDMIDMTQEAQILLDQEDFRKYVRDEWGWKRQFTNVTSNYLGS